MKSSGKSLWLVASVMTGLLACAPGALGSEWPPDLVLSIEACHGYRSGVPVLVRAELRRASGRAAREVWDADVALSADNPSIRLAPSVVHLYNGVGSALVTVTGSEDFALEAAVSSLAAQRDIVCLDTQTVTTVSGSLPGIEITWSGTVHVTGDLAVAADQVLTLLPGTLVLVDGVAGGTNGVDIDVAGSIQSLGTGEQPVMITAADPRLAWGQIRHAGAVPSVYRHTVVTRAGHSPHIGHTGSGTAFRVAGAPLSFFDCVISDDKFDEPNVRVLFFVTNSIVESGNTAADAIITDYDPANIVITHSDLGEPWPGTANTTNAAVFLNPSGGNYRLCDGSDCIDSGTNETWTATGNDLDGVARRRGSGPDRGCYEFGAPHVDFTASITEGIVPLPVTFDAVACGSMTGTLYYAWDLDGDGAPEARGAGLSVVPYVYTNAGCYDVVLTVSNEAGVHIAERPRRRCRWGSIDLGDGTAKQRDQEQPRDRGRFDCGWRGGVS